MTSFYFHFHKKIRVNFIFDLAKTIFFREVDRKFESDCRIPNGYLS